jgi:hypothetical protein
MNLSKISASPGKELLLSALGWILACLSFAKSQFVFMNHESWRTKIENQKF